MKLGPRQRKCHHALANAALGGEPSQANFDLELKLPTQVLT